MPQAFLSINIETARFGGIYGSMTSEASIVQAGAEAKTSAGARAQECCGRTGISVNPIISIECKFALFPRPACGERVRERGA